MVTRNAKFQISKEIQWYLDFIKNVLNIGQCKPG